MTSATITERASSKGKRKYTPVVRYSYTAGRDNAEFTSSRIHARSQSGGARSVANSVIARYAPGTKVNVHVDPERPDNAMLEPGMRRDDWMELTFIGAGLLGVLGLLATAWHLTKRLGPGYVAGMRLREGATVRVRPETCGSLAGGLFTGAVIAVIGCALGRAVGDFDAVWLAGIMLTAVAIALIIWIGGSKLAERPLSADLSLDYEKEIVTSPKVSGFKPEVISMTAVTGTAINAVESFNGKAKTTTYQVHLSDAERTFGPVAAVFSSEETAKVFEKWLREQLALSDA